MDLDVVGDAILMVGNDALDLFGVPRGLQVHDTIFATKAACNEYVVPDG